MSSDYYQLAFRISILHGICLQHFRYQHRFRAEMSNFVVHNAIYGIGYYEYSTGALFGNVRELARFRDMCHGGQRHKNIRLKMCEKYFWQL